MKKHIDTRKAAKDLEKVFNRILGDYDELKSAGASDEEIRDYLLYSFISVINWVDYGFNQDKEAEK